jgi:hypothetical protein
MNVKPVLGFAGGTILILAGCGSTAPTAPAPVLKPSALNGNWLITGDMPDFLLSLGTTRKFGIAVTLDVVNGQVYGSIAESYPCSGILSVGFASGLVPAPIAADGSFTLQTGSPILTPTLTLTIQGNVPTTTSASWSGTYSATNSNTGCSPVSGAFTAIPIQPVAGTFSGAGTLGALAPNATMTVMLQQGGPSTLDPPSGFALINSVNALTGSITLQGTPCAASGTLDIPGGVILGNNVSASFTMSDGSRLLLHGFLDDPAVPSIHVQSVLITGGPCDNVFGFTNTIFLKQ